jgi:hypothetical protein
MRETEQILETTPVIKDGAIGWAASNDILEGTTFRDESKDVWSGVGEYERRRAEEVTKGTSS